LFLRREGRRQHNSLLMNSTL